jgi:BolA protein
MLMLLLACLMALTCQAFLVASPSTPLTTTRRAARTSLAAAADGAVAVPGEVGAVESCRIKIQAALSPVELVVKSSNDDPNGSHIALRVISAAFEGKNRVQRQQVVYKAIWEELSGPIHAVDELVCRTPAEEGM